MRECTFFPLSSAGLLGWGLGEGDGQACFFFFNSWWKVDFTHHLFTLSQLCHSGIHSDNPLEAGAGPAPPWSLTSEPCRALLNGYKPQAGLQGSPHKAQCPPAHRLWAWGLLPACQGPQCSHGWGWADRVLAVTPGLCGGRDLWQGYVLDCAWTDLLDPSGSCHWLAGSFRQVPSCPSVSLFPGRHCRGGLLEAPPTRKGVNPKFARLWTVARLCALKVPACLWLVRGISPQRAALALLFPPSNRTALQRETLRLSAPDSAVPAAQPGQAPVPGGLCFKDSSYVNALKTNRSELAVSLEQPFLH